MKDEVGKKAKELYLTQWTIPPNEFEELDSDVKNQWRITAKHCLAEEIRARIEQVNECRLEDWDIPTKDLMNQEFGFIQGAKSAIRNHQEWCDARIKEFEAQLAELELYGK